jgi:hypothetical protein
MTKPKESRNQFWLDMRTEEGRAQVAVDISTLTRNERLFLFDLLNSASKGKRITFGVGEADGGDQVMQFTFSESVIPLANGGEQIAVQ